MATTFILSDEQVNSHGFKVLTQGIKLGRFMQNPVMFYNHDTSRMPIGRWENMRVEDDRLVAEAVFDSGDELGAEVARKVEEGFIKGCSIAIHIEDMDDSQPEPCVTYCTLMEASVCPMGSNPGAVRLTAEDGTPLPDDIEILSLLNNNNMNKEPNKETVELQAQLAAAQADNATLQQEVATLKAQLATAHDKELQALVDSAEADGRITASQKQHWLDMLHLAEDSATALLQSMAPAMSLSQQLSQHQGASRYAGLSWRDMDKRGMLAAYKRDDPEGFRQLYKETFNKEYIG